MGENLGNLTKGPPWQAHWTLCPFCQDHHVESQHTVYHGEQPAGFVGYRGVSEGRGMHLCRVRTNSHKPVELLFERQVLKPAFLAQHEANHSLRCQGELAGAQ